MRLLFILSVLTMLLNAECSEKQITEATNFYYQAQNIEEPKKQIELLSNALKACYSAEIEANMLILKAQEEKDKNKKIAYYKDSLVAISLFQDKELLVIEQDKINYQLYQLYLSIDKSIANEYKNKVQEKSSTKQASNTFKYSFFGILIFLIFSLIYFTFKKIA